ncbi:MAG: hypothetical protein Tp118DCM00d2C30442581_36 [Prokaryotic dsDNA virus sp.]|nr:MAG: hypothetical protein Tp118DCM00d2C30442581_36 [Prokaryotic dsDNA virus sp.]|tara:strand:- start:22944 stop:23390 length:447 start_codon:yes stop_codon:yes gene_type:complete
MQQNINDIQIKEVDIEIEVETDTPWDTETTTIRDVESEINSIKDELRDNHGIVISNVDWNEYEMITLDIEDSCLEVKNQRCQLTDIENQKVRPVKYNNKWIWVSKIGLGWIILDDILKLNDIDWEGWENARGKEDLTSMTWEINDNRY